MDAQSAEGTVNQILFEIDRVPDLTSPEPVTDCVDAMFEGRYFMHSAAEYLEAIDIVVPAGHLPERSLRFSQDYNEQQLLDFLGRVGAELRTRLAEQPASS